MLILARQEKQKILNFLGDVYCGASTWGADNGNCSDIGIEMGQGTQDAWLLVKKKCQNVV